MSELAGRLATASTLPIMLDSTEPDVLAAGLERLGGRCVVNSVNYEDGDGPDSRFTRTMRLVSEHGAAVVASCIDEEGQARTAQWKVRVAERLISDVAERWGMRPADVVVDCLVFPITTGQGRCGATRWRRSRRSASSSGATRKCRPRSGCPTSPSG
jgi:5-methyltetrahydrofolate--homocysteine methyltransferase